MGTATTATRPFCTKYLSVEGAYPLAWVSSAIVRWLAAHAGSMQRPVSFTPAQPNEGSSSGAAVSALWCVMQTQRGEHHDRTARHRDCSQAALPSCAKAHPGRLQHGMSVEHGASVEHGMSVEPRKPFSAEAMAACVGLQQIVPKNNSAA